MNLLFFNVYVQNVMTTVNNYIKNKFGARYI